MKKVYLSQLREGSRVYSSFLVNRKLSLRKKDGSEFCKFILQDKTGKMVAVAWSEALKGGANEISQGELVAVEGQVTSYDGELQLTIERIEKLPASLFTDLSDYVRTPQKPVEQLLEELNSLIKSVKSADLRQLLERFFSDEKFLERFVKSPAATTYHHAYPGGLLEHTVTVAHVCKHLAHLYRKVSHDLVITGALLHDIGKIHEYADPNVGGLTDQGKFLGHIAIGYGMVQKVIEETPGFGEKLKQQVLHIIVSHHGMLEYGSPQRPKTREAFIVFHADHLDADIAGFEELEVETPGSSWSKYAKNFESSVFLEQLEPDAEDQEDR